MTTEENPPEKNKTNTPAQMVYDASMKSAVKARDDTSDSALRTYNAAVAAARKTYNSESENAWRVYEAAVEAAVEAMRKAYDFAKEMEVSQ